MSWRPEGWENPFEGATPFHIKNHCMRPETCECDEHDAFETGANAMLKMLRANGNSDILPFFYAVVKTRPLETIGKGKFLFIPDEEEEDAQLP